MTGVQTCALPISDGEGAIGKMRLELMALGIEVDVSAAGGHVARIERRIQMVKERARAHINGRIPFTPTELCLTYLALYCVSSQDRGPGVFHRENYFQDGVLTGTWTFVPHTGIMLFAPYRTRITQCNRELKTAL